MPEHSFRLGRAEREQRDFSSGRCTAPLEDAPRQIRTGGISPVAYPPRIHAAVLVSPVSCLNLRVFNQLKQE